MYQIKYKSLGIINREKTVEGVRALHDELARIRTFGGSVQDINRVREVVR
jgi:hypothetical protein